MKIKSAMKRTLNTTINRSKSERNDVYRRIVSTDAGFDCGADSISYDANGRIATISNAEAFVECFYTQDGLDAGYVLMLSNGVSFARVVSRDAYRRELVTSVTNVVAFPSDGSISPDASYYLVSPNGGLTNSYVYSYDALSRPVTRNGTSFGYNARSEVAHDGSIGAWYSYDEIGNNTSFTANELNQYVGTSYSHSGETVEEYSLDGEMLAHESWRYYYDAKSRLVSVSELRYTDFDNPYPTNWVEVVVLSNRYDHLDRRIQKITPEATHSYFYDGWLLVKEVVANTNGTTDIVEYHWGNDLSGSRTGAAGIGGLLYLTISNSIPNSSTRQLYIPWYDNNGNVMGYWDERGKVAASFSYGAFGETYASGDNANKFPIRFSTKYHDTETGLYYYTKRFYAPSLHRWLTRDPIGESGGVNLYEMCGNTTLSDYDLVGSTPASKKNSSWRLYGKVNEMHSWNCSEWSTLTDGSACGTQAKYLAHFRQYTFSKYISLPLSCRYLFAAGVISTLEMNFDVKSAWCLVITPLEVWRKERVTGGYDFKIVMYIKKFDKHPTLKDKPEIPISKFIGKKVEYKPYDN